MMASHRTEQSTITSIEEHGTHVCYEDSAKYQNLEMEVFVCVDLVARPVRLEGDHWSASLSRAMFDLGSVADGEQLEG